MVNKVILIGNLGQDPEAPRKTNSGLSVLDISIATTRKRGGESHTDWHTVTCFGQTTDNVHKFLQKDVRYILKVVCSMIHGQMKRLVKSVRKIKLWLTTLLS